MKLLRGLYTIYGCMIFGGLFMVFFPLFFIPILLPKQHYLTGVINRYWARVMFFFIFIPLHVEYRAKLNCRQPYIFCPNHFSYLDIPVMGLNRCNTIFVGKSEIKRVPLFGYMFRKLHIVVDRKKLKSRYSSLLQSIEAIDQGKSLVIFPEGGIVSEHPPQMGRFKDGAFRTAIVKQIPIVPVTIPFNWIILPDPGFLLRWKPLKLVFHEPIPTEGLSLNDIDQLKESVYGIIEKELKKHNRDENRS